MPRTKRLASEAGLSGIVGVVDRAGAGPGKRDMSIRVLGPTGLWSQARHRSEG
jgi:hypothetical protein